MNVRSVALFAATTLLAGALACSKPNPNQPSVSFIAPVGQTPSNGQVFNFNAQPITLKITNSSKSGDATVTYSLEVATDTGFNNIVVTKDGIAEDPSGTTSVQVSGLAGNTTFYWHSFAVINGVKGQPSAMQSFFVRPQIVISAPALASPSNNGTVNGSRPAFTVNNATRTGPASTIFYLFQVSTSSSFSSTVATATIQEQANQTTFTVSNDMPAGNYFWRVQASDPANGATSPFSSTGAFTLVPFDMRQAIILNSPPDLGSWAETSRITSINFTDVAFEVDFDKRTSPDRWPDVGFGNGGSIEYTLGMCVNPNGKQWFCSAVVQFWFGRELSASGNPDEIGRNWFYDQRWAGIIGYQPADGETVGVFCAAGNLRDNGNVITKERTNVVLLPWKQSYFAQ